VHAAHVGHPILGDEKYGDVALNRQAKEANGLARLFLHAARIELPQAELQPLRIAAALPVELTRVLDSLRKG
jgi:23S rRNA pseudouridine955/2504/2580 synthase